MGHLQSGIIDSLIGLGAHEAQVKGNGENKKPRAKLRRAAGSGYYQA